MASGRILESMNRELKILLVDEVAASKLLFNKHSINTTLLNPILDERLDTTVDMREGMITNLILPDDRFAFVPMDPSGCDW